MITEAYRRLNETMHAQKPTYGSGGYKWAPAVFGACGQYKTTDVLDYGCGKATLNLHLPFSVACFDPGVPKYSARPEPHDIVVCCDVLEHVEDEYIDDVLDDLTHLTRIICLMNIGLAEANKTLPVEMHISRCTQKIGGEKRSNRDFTLATHISTVTMTVPTRRYPTCCCHHEGQRALSSIYWV